MARQETNKSRRANGSARDRKFKEYSKAIDAMPFTGTKGKMRNWWAVPKKGGYGGGCITGAAAAQAYLRFLRDNPAPGGASSLQHVALDMLGIPKSTALRGHAVGFFWALDEALRQVAPFLNFKMDDEQVRKEFFKGLQMNGAARKAYLKELIRLDGHEPRAN